MHSTSAVWSVKQIVYADYGTYYAHIDRDNDYGYDNNEQEVRSYSKISLTCRAIQDVVDSLDNQ